MLGKDLMTGDARANRAFTSSAVSSRSRARFCARRTAGKSVRRVSSFGSSSTLPRKRLSTRKGSEVRTAPPVKLLKQITHRFRATSEWVFRVGQMPPGELRTRFFCFIS